MSSKNNNILNKILIKAENERILLHHPYVGSEHLFLAILKDKSNLTDFLDTYGVNYYIFRKELVSVVGKCQKDNPDNLYTPLLRKIIKRYENKNYHNEENIEEDFFLAILDEGEGIAIRILLKMDVDLDDIYFKLKENRKLYDMEEANKIGVCLNNVINLKEKVVGRDKEVNLIIETLLRKKKCNPILIGPAGVGKSAIVEELVRRIELKNVPDCLKGNRIYMIEMGSLISGTKYRGEFEERLNKIIKEVISNKKTILFIDEIHSLVGAGGADGAINAADILKPYLARGEIKCIGATTTNEYQESIIKDQALSRRFNVINVCEPTNEEMYHLLCEIKKEYEEFHQIKISNKIIRKIVEYSGIYIRHIANPDRSIDLLDSSCAYSKMHSKNNVLEEKDVLETVFAKTNNFLIKDYEFIPKLKEELKQDMTYKDVNKICSALKIGGNKPISFLYDCEDIENIIKEKFRSIHLITIDFNEYNHESIDSIMGRKNNSDLFVSELKENPFSILLIKNLSPDLTDAINDIIRINNDGFMYSKQNEKIYFNNVIILVDGSKMNKRYRGFKESIFVNSNLHEKFINSFKCNLLGVKKKKVNIS